MSGPAIIADADQAEIIAALREACQLIAELRSDQNRYLCEECIEANSGHFEVEFRRGLRALRAVK